MGLHHPPGRGFPAGGFFIALCWSGFAPHSASVTSQFPEHLWAISGNPKFTLGNSWLPENHRMKPRSSRSGLSSSLAGPGEGVTQPPRSHSRTSADRFPAGAASSAAIRGASTTGCRERAMVNRRIRHREGFRPRFTTGPSTPTSTAPARSPPPALPVRPPPSGKPGGRLPVPPRAYQRSNIFRS